MVYENAAEFQTLADVNGDGIPDIVVTDKASGQFRIGEGQGNDSFIWRDNVGRSGLSPLSGFSAGRILTSKRDHLVFASVLDNRIQIIDTPSDSRLSEPLRVRTTLVGPSTVTALNIPGGVSSGAYTDEFLDLAYHATLHDPADPNILQYDRNDGSALPFFDSDEGLAGTDQPRRSNRIELEIGNLPAYGVLNSDGSGNRFQLLNPESGLSAEMGAVPGLPENAAYAYADFDDDDNAEFVFYQPGSTDLFSSEWTGSALTKPVTSTYPAPIAELRVISSTGAPELLVILDDRSEADRVSYTGGGSFPISESFDSSGLPIRGALSLGKSLHLLEGDGSTTSSRRFVFNGSQHDYVDTQDLPELSGRAAGSTVLLFDGAPLIDPDAQLLARYNAGPWTSGFTLNGSGAEVVSERFESPADGLGDAQPQQILSAPATTAGGLTNQIADDNSIFFRDAALGEITSSLTVTPPSGTYPRALRPSFELEGTANIFYRTSTRTPDWTLINSTPPLILDDTTLYAVASGSNGFSNVVRVDYLIEGDAGNRDSNGDGLPDFAALAQGLDPLAEDTDADGDGFTNLQEVLAGTNPTDRESAPNRNNIAFEYPNSFNLRAAPAVPDPGSGSTPLRPFTESDSAPATRMVAHQPDGFFLGADLTRSVAGLSVPAAAFDALDIVADDLFVVTATADNFEVDAGVARNYGRLVAGLAKIPALDFADFDYSGFGDNGGYNDLAAETADWRSAALAYFSGLERPEVVHDPVDPEATLELLLVEHILGEQMLARDLSDRSNLTLTPFRQIENPLEALPLGSAISDTPPQPERDRALSIALLQALQRRDAPGDQAYSVQGLIDTVRSELSTAASPNIQQLMTLAERLYTTSATSANPGALRQPFDALRRFIRSGGLTNTGYDDAPVASDFPAALLSEAAQGVNEITAAISPRTIETVTLYFAGGESAAACPVWKEVFYSAGSFDPDAPMFTGTEYALVDAQGDPFPIARAFPLTSGSVFEVTGYVLNSAPCGDVALEVIPQPELAFLRNSSPSDADGDLIPDSVEERNPQAALAPFEDSDGDGYSDLQELLDGSDPLRGGSIPTQGGSAAPVRDITPPQLKITSIGSNQAVIEFEFFPDYADSIQFPLYSTNDLTSGFSPSGGTAHHTGGGQYELIVNQSADKRFFIFRMQLK